MGEDSKKVERSRQLAQFIRDEARAVVKQEVPGNSLAVVDEIDFDQRRARVTIIGDTASVWFPFMSAIPSYIGQEVIIGGGVHDRHIIDVKGSTATSKAIEEAQASIEAQQAAIDAAEDIANGAVDAAEAAANAAADALNQSSASKSNLAELGNVEDPALRTKYPPPTSAWTYDNTGGLASSGLYYVRLAPPATTYTAYDSMPVGLRFKTEPTEKVYLRWKQRRVSANFVATMCVFYYDNTGVFLSASFVTSGPTVAVDNNVVNTYYGEVVAPTNAVEGR